MEVVQPKGNDVAIEFLFCSIFWLSTHDYRNHSSKARPHKQIDKILDNLCDWTTSVGTCSSLCLSVCVIYFLKGLSKILPRISQFIFINTPKTDGPVIHSGNLQLSVTSGQVVGSVYIGQLFLIYWIVCVRSWQVISDHWVSDWASHISSIALGQIWTELIANHKLIREYIVI